MLKHAFSILFGVNVALIIVNILLLLLINYTYRITNTIPIQIFIYVQLPNSLCLQLTFVND